MKPIEIKPSILCPKPDAYIDRDSVVLIGIDGEERAPWLAEMSIEDLLQLLGD